MLSMDALKEYVVKTNDGLARCCNMEAFYFKMITASVSDANFEKLGKALEAKDLQAREERDYTEQYKKVMEARDKLAAII